MVHRAARQPGLQPVTFTLFVRPVLARLQGAQSMMPVGMPARADFAWPKPDKRREFLRDWIAATSTKDYRHDYAYDSLSRPSSSTTTLDWGYTELETYNSFGQLATVTHRYGTVPVIVRLFPTP